MKLESINNVLRYIGLVLVVAIGQDQPTTLELMTFDTYLQRFHKKVILRLEDASADDDDIGNISQ